MQPVVDHSPLESPVAGPLEYPAGDEELVAIGRAGIDGVIAGEVALGGLGPDLPALVENSQRDAKIETLGESRSCRSALGPAGL